MSKTVSKPDQSTKSKKDSAVDEDDDDILEVFVEFPSVSWMYCYKNKKGVCMYTHLHLLGLFLLRPPPPDKKIFICMI